MHRDEQPVLREDSISSGKVAGVMSVAVEAVIVIEVGIQEGEIAEGPFEQGEISIDTLVIKELLKGWLLTRVPHQGGPIDVVGAYAIEQGRGIGDVLGFG